MLHFQALTNILILNKFYTINPLKRKLMKRKIYLSVILLCSAIAGNSQFVPVNINFQSPPYGHYPQFISIVDESNVWLGTQCGDSIVSVPYGYAVHTHDGGDTWQLDSIPMQGDPVISSVFALDANTCYYVYTDNWSGGSIWKTSDGGASWDDKTGTLFSEPGAYADFFVAFNENEGVAVGDPTLGYFEIQRTTDGGNTWTRVDSDLIPAILPGEMGATDAYSVIGDIIWFPTLIADENGTYSARCFKSVDRGQHWTTSPIIAENLAWIEMDFSTSQKGVLFDQFPNSVSGKKPLYRTSDGGDTWTLDTLSVDLNAYTGVSAVGGFDGGFVVASNELTGYLTKILFTPDFFSTVVVVDSNLQANPWGINFIEASTGWLEGDGSDANAMYKYNGLLTSIRSAVKSPEKLAIIPNPTSAEALVKLPGLNDQGDLVLMIYDTAGKLRETRPVESNTGWTKLNASSYTSGVYFVNVVSGNHLIASTKWVVQH
jgi:photosystem II stability/assembly factor-like uncharacterized protein